MLENIIKKIKYELQFNNANYYVRARDKVLKTYYRWLLKKRIMSLPPVTLSKECAVCTLAILANKKNFFESVAALYSFCFWEKNINIHYHEDGTLTEQDIDVLEKTFPGIVIFRRKEEDVTVAAYLSSKRMVNCARLRSHFIFSIRLFDMLARKRTPYLIQIDSDVLFFSKPTEILDIIQTGKANGCYNRDVIDAYTFDKAAISKYIDKPVVNNFNAGVFLHNFDEAFWDFAENVLAHEPGAAESWHLEQTLFAMYVSLKGAFVELPRQYDLGRREKIAGTPIISEHYVHNTGYDFHKDFINRLAPVYLGNQ